VALLDDPARGARMGRAGAARTRGEFAIDSVRRAIESVYGTAEARTTEEAADPASGR